MKGVVVINFFDWLLSYREILILIIVAWFIFAHTNINQKIVAVILKQKYESFFTNSERFRGMLLRGFFLALAFSLWITGMIFMVFSFLMILYFSIKFQLRYNDIINTDNHEEMSYSGYKKILSLSLNVFFGCLGGFLVSLFF